MLNDKIQINEEDNVLIKKEEEERKQQVVRSITGRIMPITFLKGDKKQRKTVYLKEALIFSVFLTVLDFIAFYKLSYFDMLHLFDTSLWNVIATISLTLLVLFIGTYILDYFITEIYLKIRKKRNKKKR